MGVLSAHDCRTAGRWVVGKDGIIRLESRLPHAQVPPGISHADALVLCHALHPCPIPPHQQRNRYGRPIVFRGRGLSVFRSQASSPISLHDRYLAAAAWTSVPHVPCSQKRDSTKCNLLGGVLSCTWNHPRGTQLKASSLPYPFSGQSLGRQGCHHSGRQAAV